MTRKVFSPLVTRGSNATCVLVPQADSLGAVGVIRSLGQNGYIVHAASNKAGALGCRSAFASASYHCPSYENQNYLLWLRETILTQQIAAIIPSEGFLLAIRHCFSEFSPLMAIPDDAQLVYGCLSKAWVFDNFLHSDNDRLRQHIPRTIVLNRPAELKAVDFRDWRLPFFVKGDGFYAKQGNKALVRKVQSIAEAHQAVLEAFADFDKVLLQDCSSGVKATVNLLMQDGVILAESMVIASHENPHTGGLTSLRSSWWYQPMYEDAVMRMRALNWNGPAMVEYKWDANNQTFDFIELNSRYWAALNLDILAGIHFPAIQMDYFLFGAKPKNTARLTSKICCRHAFPAEFGYLVSKIKDPQVKLKHKIKSLLGFFVYFLHPAIKSDLNYQGDRRLVFINLKNFISELINHVKKN